MCCFFLNSVNFEQYSMTKMVSMLSHISVRKRKNLIPSPVLNCHLYVASSSSTERVRIVTALQDVTVTSGEDAKFVCELSHADVAEGVWWLGSSPLQRNEMNQMTCQGCQHRLVLAMTTPEETGTVAFVVGEERTSAHLLVVPKPKGERQNNIVCVREL